MPHTIQLLVVFIRTGLLVLLVEFVLTSITFNTTCGVNQLLLSCEEGVTRGANFNLHFLDG